MKRAAKKQPGSILDLLPRRGSVEYNALPKFIRTQVDEFRRAGGRAAVPDDLAELAQIPKRLSDLGVEQRVLASTIRDVHKAQSDLGGRILAALAEVQKEQAEHRSQLSDHGKRLDGHDVQIGVHARKHVEQDKKHEEHVEHITGIHARLDVVEQHITTKRPARRGKKQP